MVSIRQAHISAGGNRHPNAADWQHDTLAFGSGHNVALWRPTDGDHRGIHALLRGHTDTVQAVKFLDLPGQGRPLIISGSADKTVRLWSRGTGDAYTQIGQAAHEGSVNTIAVLPGCETFVSGAADGVVKVWTIAGRQVDDSKSERPTDSEVGIVSREFRMIQSINLRPRFIPLASALARLEDGTLVFAVAGTSPNIQIYVQSNSSVELAATMSGHEGWIRSLAFTSETNAAGSDLLLVSASQDKYIRLWRIHKGSELPQSSAAQDPSLGVLARSLSNKPHYIGQGESLHSVTFEALLIGHEDWIYTAQWKLKNDGPVLLTTSADNSVSFWRRQEDSGFWICETRLGAISAQKGSTTATGSAGGFWIGLWSPDGDSIASLSRTGSWRVWQLQRDIGAWEQAVGISGHTKEVKSLAWTGDGGALLTTGSDQTTRLLGPWKEGDRETWHEIARPQIHGYDLNCIDTLGVRQFISGADEKLLRVFNKPRLTAKLLSKLGATDDSTIEELPDSANIPVLGLSNKMATKEDLEGEEGVAVADGELETNGTTTNSEDLDHPPFEDLLSRRTLWPEHEKLYGHGYEISAVAATHDGKLVATACRASSIDHAVIRLYETTDWREIKPPLSSHSLTVTSLCFSPSDDQLLSVGRDRQWSVFQRAEAGSHHFVLKHSNPKGHSRMILDCAWLPTDAPAFATAGRDKSVKIWSANEDGSGYACRLSTPTQTPATAVACSGGRHEADALLLAWGTDEGEVAVGQLDIHSWTIKSQQSLERSKWPAGAVNGVRWRPHMGDRRQMLALASDDCSVRLYHVDEGS